MVPDTQNFKALYAGLASSISPHCFNPMSSLLTIQHMMVDLFDLKFENLTPDAQLDSLGIDSLSVIEFMFKLEDELHIKMPDERLEIKTVGDVVNIVDQMICAQKACG